MKSFKDLRKTFHRERSSSRSASFSTTAKQAATLQPPKQVIRATSDYVSSSPYELSFQKGDFFHVLVDTPSPQQPGWIEACNPMINVRGLVPSSHFEVLQRSSPSSAFSLMSRSDANPNGAPVLPASKAADGASTSAQPARAPGGVYATVLYDFVAERPQELSVQKGDAVVIVAQSNYEWFVAKPLWRLSAPGLIPVSFVEIRNPATDEVIPNARHVIDQGLVPSLAQWEQMNERFRQNAIPLGKLDSMPANESTTRSSGSRAPSDAGSAAHEDPGVVAPLMSSQRDSQRSASNEPILPMGILTAATVDAFRMERSDCWFCIRASYASALTSSKSPDVYQGHEVRELLLYRLYEDFKEFHTALTETFGAHVSKETGGAQYSLPSLSLFPRSLNTMQAGEARAVLDRYMGELCTLPEGALRSSAFRAFLEPRLGDQWLVSASPFLPNYAPRVSGTPQDLDTSFENSSFSFSNTSGSRSLHMASGFSAIDADRQHHQTPRSRTWGSESQDPSTSPTLDNLKLGTPVESPAQETPPPYHRVKIMRRGDPGQLIAVRMPSNYSHQTLLAKAQEKLGADIRSLRSNQTNGSADISSDQDLAAWLHASLTSRKKLLLYADV